MAQFSISRTFVTTVKLAKNFSVVSAQLEAGFMRQWNHLIKRGLYVDVTTVIRELMTAKKS